MSVGALDSISSSTEGDGLVFDDDGRGFFPPEGFMNEDLANGAADMVGVIVDPSSKNTESKSAGDNVGISSFNIEGDGLGGLLFSPHSGVHIGFSSQ